LYTAAAKPHSSDVQLPISCSQVSQVKGGIGEASQVKRGIGEASQVKGGIGEASQVKRGIGEASFGQYYNYLNK